MENKYKKKNTHTHSIFVGVAFAQMSQSSPRTRFGLGMVFTLLQSNNHRFDEQSNYIFTQQQCCLLFKIPCDEFKIPKKKIKNKKRVEEKWGEFKWIFFFFGWVGEW